MASQGWEICSTWATDEAADSLLSHHVTVRTVHSSDGTGLAENGRIRLVPGPEKQSCEVTVKFLQQKHAIHHIYVLSTARTCEVYRQNEGDTDAEYLCTARGQLETNEEVSEDKPMKLLHRAEMDLEDPDLCTSVTIRLLSLQEKSHVIVGHILILVSSGPFLGGGAPNSPSPLQAAVGGGTSASSLGALAPFMLQLAQGFSMPDMRNKMSFIGNTGTESISEGVQSQQRGSLSHEETSRRALALKADMETQSPPQSSTKSEALLADVCQRLERLESVCARIETSLCKTLESFDKRLQILEIGVDKPSGP